MDAAPLAGLVVLDLSRYLPGPLCTLLLAERGARVIRIEPPDGDPVRRMPPFHGEDGAFHAFLGRGKESVVLDLKHEAGLEAARRLADRADVLVESFRPGVLARLGLDPANLRARRPALVTCSIPGFAAGSGRADRAGHDLTYLAWSGALGTLPATAAPPLPPAVQIADCAGGLRAAFEITTALAGRSRTGVGAAIEVSLEDAARLCAAPHALGAGNDDAAGAILTGGLACYRVYRCADGRHLAVAALEERFFARLCALLELPELPARQHDPTEQEALADALASRIAERPLEHWTQLLAGEDTCAAPVLGLREAIPEPLRVAGARLSPAPPLGADTERVLREIAP